MAKKAIAKMTPGRKKAAKREQAIEATGSRTHRTPVRRLSATSRKVTPTPTADSDTSTVVGVRISHPDRLIYPDLGISKLQLARYYEDIADWIVPHVAGRPLTLVHCPAGLAAPCVYLKHAKAWGPSALRRVKIQEKTKVGEYLVADWDCHQEISDATFAAVQAL